MVTAKDFAMSKVLEIEQLCQELKYINNKELRIFGIERINKLAEGIEEHLEYLEVINDKNEEE